MPVPLHLLHAPREVFGRDFAFLPRGQLLTFEELTRLARVFAGLGVRKLRLTGGEPLLRRDLEKLVAMLAGVGGIQDIALTTNGALLAGKAQALAAAGLRRVTVSLDSLDDTVFMALNDAGFPVARALEAITAAAGAGLAPVKVNMVVRRGVNEQSILPMAAHFRHSGHVLRFIEYMDVGTTQRLAAGGGRPGRGDDLPDRRAVAPGARRSGLSRRGRPPVPLP